MEEFRQRVEAAIRKYRLTFSHERGMQDHLAEVFRRDGFGFEREFVLGPNERPDFFDRVTGFAIEVKVGGGLNNHLAQLKRYNAHEAVKGSVLVCTRPYVLPATLGGKPVGIINVGGIRL